MGDKGPFPLLFHLLRKWGSSSNENHDVKRGGKKLFFSKTHKFFILLTVSVFP